MRRFILILMILFVTSTCLGNNISKEYDRFVVDGVIYRAELAGYAVITGIQNDAVSVVFPDKVTYDGVNYVVRGYTDNCYSDDVNNTLEKVNTGGVGQIGNSFFKNCIALQDVVIPNVNRIGWEAFRGCISLTSIELPKVKYLAEGCFRDCTSLKMCTVEMVEQIEPQIFKNCTSLESLVFESKRIRGVYDPRTFSDMKDGEYVMPDDYIDPMYPEYFVGCTSLSELVFKGVYIPYCTSVNDRGIPYGSLVGCTALMQLYINNDWIYPSNIISVPPDLKTLIIGNNCISFFAANAISGCDISEIHCMFPIPPVCLDSESIELDKKKCVVYVPNGCRERYMQSEYWCQFANVVEDVSVKPCFAPEMGPCDNVFVCDSYGYQFNGHENELSVSLPYFQYVGVQNEMPMFINFVLEDNCDLLYSTTVFSNNREFFFRTTCDPIVINGCEYKVTQIAPFTAMNYCNLTAIEIGEGIESIGGYAFANAKIVGSSEISLPSTLRYIGAGAFDGVDFSGYLTCYAVQPPMLEDNSFFSDMYNRQQITLYVPAESVDIYKSTSVWRDFNIMAMAEVEDVAVEISTSEADYFNLQGMRVTPDHTGIYIRCVDGSVTKVFIR